MSDMNTPAVTTPWGRQQATGGERATSRTRKMVQGLPGWEPLPPGETLAPRKHRS